MWASDFCQVRCPCELVFVVELSVANNHFSLPNYGVTIEQVLLSNSLLPGNLFFIAKLYVANESIFVVELCVASKSVFVAELWCQ
jgi:hypothetical protein